MPGTETVLPGGQKKKVTSITNSYSNNLTHSKLYPNYWSPLTSLGDKLDEADMYKPSATFNMKSAREKTLRTKCTSESTKTLQKRSMCNKSTTSNICNNINETERRRIGEEMANTVSEMEIEIDNMLAELDQINESINRLLDKSEPQSFETTQNGTEQVLEENPSAVYDSGATSGVATENDAKYLIATGKKPNNVFVIVRGLRYKLRMMGIPVDEPVFVFGDN